ncbi:PepSY-associated TM helix domain-containing protein [Tardiphaga sp.]|uniref:PepSY-associated TM helix domain-containing protein n=1 Tax=Tardiphaga sp. TaxID=1926292 RepID=UPI0026198B6D|nr:PepSY-associated TM helix domain-containing protein [Tardiphaga sp.]MDB5619891.1 PepSY-associated helix [Tardiphaga sp.]
MEQGFRASMGWLHTWAGVVVGAMLFAIFWMGTLAVFDREIDRWMAPMTRIALPDSPRAFDELRATYDTAVAVRSPTWTVLQATERQPYVRVAYRDKTGVVNRSFDPATGAVLPEPGTWAGSRFLYPYHYGLHLKIWNIGQWIVGFAGMAMLLLCVSGVVIHRKIFVDFFTLRPQQKSQRVVLDLHTVSGVLGLPFNIAITLSGLIIFFAVYFPSGWQAVYADKQAFNADGGSSYARPKANKPGSLGSLDAMAGEARRLWDGVEPRAILVRHPGDAAGFVTMFQSIEERIVRHSASITFDAATGAVLHRSEALRPVAVAQRFLTGVHRIQFRHWTLRFMYFALGLLGCALIMTGVLFWLEMRRKRHAAEGLRGVRLVQGLAIGATAGIVMATAGFMVINRLLPLDVTLAGYERHELEIWTFHLVWIAAFAHAWMRSRTAWVEQCQAIAALALAAMVLNGLTTGDHPLRSLAHAHLWPVAGVDVALLLLAAGALASSRRLAASRRRSAAAVAALKGAGSHA